MPTVEVADAEIAIVLVTVAPLVGEIQVTEGPMYFQKT